MFPAVTTRPLARDAPSHAEAAHEAVERTWCRAFDAVRGQHRDVREVDLGDAGDRRRHRALCRSLATFQLGESGNGEHLLVAAVHSGASPDHLSALRCFVAEEQEHARLLAIVLRGFDHPLRTRHWTDSAFVAIRRARSLRTAVLTLLVAEVIALSYYAALKDGSSAPALRDIFRRIHADEIRHVAFHTETLPRYLEQCHPMSRRVGRVAWNGLVATTALVVAWDHGEALAQAGVGRSEFVRRVHHDRRRVDRLLFVRRRAS